ncbi:uncharacterized protein LOC103523450 isoform X2 [Diaphorina citri]|uniref:Uncharacterized protein LOC103523450 isoform X2 n=1 Tax=Diaphorina citri TaxID=121845 RepID=A0A3Q0JKD8_DIACI|nr:uncharacterized protein LOC103523450 isoform X2 [Diaphorina citri]
MFQVVHCTSKALGSAEGKNKELIFDSIEDIEKWVKIHCLHEECPEVKLRGPDGSLQFVQINTEDIEDESSSSEHAEITKDHGQNGGQSGKSGKHHDKNSNSHLSTTTTTSNADDTSSGGGWNLGGWDLGLGSWGLGSGWGAGGSTPTAGVTTPGVGVTNSGVGKATNKGVGVATKPEVGASGASTGSSWGLGLGVTTPGVGVTTIKGVTEVKNPGVGVTTPGVGVTTPGVGVTTKGVTEVKNPGVGASSGSSWGLGSGWGLTTPGVGVTTPGVGVTTPGVGVTTKGVTEVKNPGVGASSGSSWGLGSGWGLTTPGVGVTTKSVTEVSNRDAGETGQGVGYGLDYLSWLSPLNYGRKLLKRGNNVIATCNDINLGLFKQASEGYQNFQKDIQKKADESAGASILSPLVSKLNAVGSMIDRSNHVLFNGAHAGIDTLAGHTRNNLNVIKPYVKDMSKSKKYQAQSSVNLL